MDRYRVLFGGAVLTAVFAFFVLAFLPQMQLSKVVPMDPLRPYSEAAAAGRRVYITDGCVFCHSQQVRGENYGNDQARGWGRPSYPEDYRYDEPHLLGTMRTGPDLMNIGARQPSRAWQLTHLYEPRALVPGSIMPSFRYHFEIKAQADPGDEVVELPEAYRPASGVVVAKPEARRLVDYLVSMNHTYQRADMRTAPSGAAPAAH